MHGYGELIPRLQIDGVQKRPVKNNPHRIPDLCKSLRHDVKLCFTTAKVNIRSAVVMVRPGCGAVLFDSNAFREVAGLVDIATAQDRDVVGEELQGNDA
jgi:hypothetical protein